MQVALLSDIHATVRHKINENEMSQKRIAEAGHFATINVSNPMNTNGPSENGRVFNEFIAAGAQFEADVLQLRLPPPRARFSNWR